MQTGVGAKTFALAESTKSLFENSDEGMMLIKKTKSIAGEPGIQIYDFTKEMVESIETAGFISKEIFEADMFLKNQIDADDKNQYRTDQRKIPQRSHRQTRF